MDEYEVDLMDYLQVIWKGKWIILACLIVAIAVSTSVMWTRPDEYKATRSYRVYQSLSVLGISHLENREVVNTVLDFKNSYKDEKLAIAAEIKDDRVLVTLTGTTPLSDITQAFDRLESSVTDKLEEYVREQTEQTVFSTSMQIDQLTQQRDGLKAQINALDSPSSDDPLFTHLAEKVSNLEAQLVQSQVMLEALKNIDPTSLFALKAVGELTVSQIGPNRKMSVAVAVVLGLFVGILLAFFVHYLKSARKQEQ